MDQCHATTRTGDRCRNKPQPDTDLCYNHAHQSTTILNLAAERAKRRPHTPPPALNLDEQILTSLHALQSIKTEADPVLFIETPELIRKLGYVYQTLCHLHEDRRTTNRSTQ